MRERRRRCQPAAHLAVGLLLLTASTDARQRQVDTSTYASELSVLAARISTANAADIPQVRTLVPSMWAVRVRDRVVEVPGLWIGAMLDEGTRDPAAWPATRTSIVTRLTATAAEAQRMSVPISTLDGGRARATLDEILSRPEYGRIAQESAMDVLRDRIAEWIRRVWAGIGGDRFGLRTPAQVFAWLAALAAAAILIAWLVHSLRASTRRVRVAADAPRASARSARGWALMAKAAHEPREVVRCAYRATVCRLEEEGAWRSDPARTPREYGRLLAPAHGRAPLAAEVTRRFEEVWFAARPASAEDRDSMLARLRELGCLPAD